jgi:hypothetical protein
MQMMTLQQLTRKGDTVSEIRGLVMNAESVLQLRDRAVPILAWLYVVCHLPSLVTHIADTTDNSPMDETQLATWLLIKVIVAQLENVVVFLLTARLLCYCY